jgi:hypothetical protein
MSDGNVYPITVAPGIKRDGTILDAEAYVNGLWCRFQRGRPKKMGGYREITSMMTGISRGIFLLTENAVSLIFNGFSSGMEIWNMDQNGNSGGVTTASLTGFASNANNLWQIDAQQDKAGYLALLAHPGQNLNDITSQVNTQLLAGNATGTSFTGVVDTANSNAPVSISGGVCCIHPYTFVYGNNGLIWNNTAGDLTKWSGAANPDANTANMATGKIVKGLPIRGGTSSPAGLFWSLDSLIRVTFVGAQTVSTGPGAIYWRYDVVSSQTSIMSSQSVIEYDGIYYWIGLDRFLFYNGVIKEVPNQMNMNWFFDNINYNNRNKVWATKIPRYGEIWWFYPRGNSTECNDAIIYNVREGTWYDAGQALGATRSAGYFTETFRSPVWAGTTLNSGMVSLWQHEFGADQSQGTQTVAVQSYIETNCLGWVSQGPAEATQGPKVQNPSVGKNLWLRLERIEPDFVQSGQMTMYVTGRSYANDTDITTAYTFQPTDTKIDLKEQRRQLRLRFESNTQGGKFEMGSVLAQADVGDVRGTT